MKKAALCIGKILLSAATLPLWFIKIFKGVGHLPNEDTGKIVEVIFRHSMFENIYDASLPTLTFLPYISMAIAILSVALNIVVLKCPNNKKIQTAGNVAFFLAIGLFLILMLFASTVARGY